MEHIYKQRSIRLLFGLILISLNSYSQVVAQDGTKYDTVTIGTNVWFSSDLDVTTFVNGVHIMEAKTIDDWTQAENQKRPVWSYFLFDAKYKQYGKLYNKYAIFGGQKIAPIGWHVPSDEDWLSLLADLGGDRNSSYLTLKSKTGWENNSNGNDSTGFSALPGGGLYIPHLKGTVSNFFVNMGRDVVFWTSSLNFGRPKIFTICNEFNAQGIGGTCCQFDIQGFYVRCVKDK